MPKAPLKLRIFDKLTNQFVNEETAKFYDLELNGAGTGYYSLIRFSVFNESPDKATGVWLAMLRKDYEVHFSIDGGNNWTGMKLPEELYEEEVE